MPEKSHQTCRICGVHLPPKKPAGRRRIYCSKVCRRLAEFEVRRLETRIERLETEAENCRRDHSGLLGGFGETVEQRLADIAEETRLAVARLRVLLA